MNNEFTAYECALLREGLIASIKQYEDCEFAATMAKYDSERQVRLIDLLAKFEAIQCRAGLNRSLAMTELY